MNLIQKCFLRQIFKHFYVNWLIYGKVLIDPNFTAIIFVDSDHFVRYKKGAKYVKKFLEANDSFSE
jgi:hypothetical protein